MQGSLILTAHHDPVAPFADHGFHTLLQHRASAWIDVAPLATGTAHHITGQIQVGRRDASGDRALISLHHFKLTDATLRVFAPGQGSTV
jgi:hypothetical protein